MGMRRTRTWRIVVLVIILAIAIGGFRLLVKTRPSAPPVAVEEPIWPVTAVVAQMGNHAPIITLFGRISSPQATTLSAAITADVQAVPVRDGDSVVQTQLLVQLNPQDARLLVQQREAEYAEAQALLHSEQIHHQNNLEALALEQQLLGLAQNELERAQRLKRDQLASQTRIDEAQQVVVKQQLSVSQRQLAINDHQAKLAQLQANVAKAEVQRESARLELARSRILAPYAATITQVQVAPGERVRAGDPLVELFAAGSLEVRAQIPTQHVPLLRAALADNTPMQASLAGNLFAPAGLTPRFQLIRLTSNIKSGDSNVEGIFSIEGDGGSLAQGQVLELHLQLPMKRDVFTLPVEAIYGSDRVYQILDGRLKSQTIQRLGLSYDSQGKEQVILRAAQLQDGDQILSSQLPNAIDGMRVKPQLAQ